MPSKSKSQARFMAAAAHNPEFAKDAGISTDTATEWNKADEKSGTLKKGSNKPEKVKESTMRGWMDVVQDADIANEIDDTEEQVDISQRSPSINEDSEQTLEEMPQRFDSFAKQNRDEFVDKVEAQARKRGLEPFAEHDTFDVFRTADKSALIAYDKNGKQIAMMSGIITNRAVMGVRNVFQVNSTASKTGTKGIMYQMFMDLLDNGYSVLSDSIHSPDAIKFWTRLMGNHTVYVVGDGEVLARAKPEKANKYWDDDEDSPSAELRLLLVK